MKLRWAIFAAVSLLWGSEWIFGLMLVEVPHFRLLALRFLAAALLFVPWVARRRLSVSLGFIAENILLSAILIAAPALFLGSRPALSPGMVVLLFALLPLIASMLESDGISQAPLLLGGLAGTAFLVRNGLSLGLSQGVAALLLLLIVVASAVVLVRAKRWLPDGDLCVAVGAQMLTAAVVCGAYSAFSERGAVVNWTVKEAFAVVCLGLISAASYFGFYWLVRNDAVSKVTTIQWLTPVVSITGTAIWLHHLPTWDASVGGALSATCAILYFRKAAGEDATLTLKITASPDTKFLHPPQDGP